MSKDKDERTNKEFIAALRAELRKCPVCFALVSASDMEAHDNWHTLTTSPLASILRSAFTTPPSTKTKDTP